MELSSQTDKIQCLISEFLSEERVLNYLKLYEAKETEMKKKAQQFHDFYAFFKYCPLCGKSNHIEYMRRFFFSSKDHHIKLKEILMDFVENPHYIKRGVIMGVPCCNCFEKNFTE